MVFVAAASFAAVLIAGAALAGPMMKPGPAPESSFTGTWRFIGAQSAPWVRARKLTKADAPLLEYAIKLKDGAVEGPPPLSCKDARYTEGVSTHDELFGGKLKGDKGFALARKIGLSQGEIDTERVICNGKVFDFYFTDIAQFLLGAGGVIYTLEQPTGMEPDQYKPGFTGPGFDCTRAAATLDRLICMDASLSKSDRRLNENYRALKATVSPQSFATFQSAQREWLAYVRKRCGAGVPFPDFVGDRNSIVDCMESAYSDRADMFEGLKGQTAGVLKLEPRMRFHTRAKAEEGDIYPFMSGGPQTAAFNAFIAKTMKLDRWRMDDPEIIPQDDGGDTQLYTWRAYGVARFDARIVSFQISTDDFAGSHDAREVAGYTWDVAKARVVTLADVFAANANWKKALIPFCQKSLHTQFEDREAPDLDIAEITATLADPGSWQWGKDKATVVFWVDLIGGMPGGEFDVAIPYRMLKPYMKPDAPVMPS